MRESYTEMNKRHQKIINELPLYWAFSDKQFNKVLEELNVTRDELMSGPSGSIIKKTDKDIVLNTLKELDFKMKKALTDMDFFKEAVIYEMSNHEYQINCQGDYDVLSSLGFNVRYEKEWECLSEEQRMTYIKARREYLNSCED